MKKILLSLSVILFGSIAMNAQSVSVNTDGSTADASSIFDVKSTTKGMLVPRMTTAQRTAIVSPANGLLVYDTDVKSFWYYNGTAWTNITAASGGAGNLSLPFYTSVNVNDSAFHIKNLSNIGIAGESEQGAGLVGKSKTGSGVEAISTNGTGVYASSNTGAGVNALSANGFGIISNSINGTAIYGFSNNTLPTTKSTNNGSGSGVEANSANGSGLYASSNNGAGINALSNNGMGVVATSTNGTAVYGFNANANPAIKGVNTTGEGIIGTTSAANKAGVKGEATGANTSGVQGISTGTNANGVWGYNATSVGVLGSSNTGTGVKAMSNGGLALDVAGNVKVSGGNTNPSYGAVLTSDAGGNATWQNNRIAFRAYGTIAPDFETGLNVIHSSTDAIAIYRYKVEFGQVNYNFGNGYHGYALNSATSNTFIAPVAGVYHFDAGIKLSENIVLNVKDMELTIMLQRNGQIYEMTTAGHYVNDVDNVSVNLSDNLYLQQGDKVWVAARQYNLVMMPSWLNDSPIQNYFSGYLLFRQ